MRPRSWLQMRAQSIATRASVEHSTSTTAKRREQCQSSIWILRVHRHSAFVAPWLLRFFRQSGHGLGPQRRPLRVHWFFADRYQPCAVAATDLALPQRDTTRQIMTLVAELVVDQ